LYSRKEFKILFSNNDYNFDTKSFLYALNDFCLKNKIFTGLYRPPFTPVQRIFQLTCSNFGNKFSNMNFIPVIFDKTHVR